MPVSGSQEDYVKIIWYMERDQIKATAKNVADRYQVKPPTVLSMFKQLKTMNLITYDKNAGASLTGEGNNLAHKLIRKHRLIETFLEQVLGMDNQLLHEEAEKLEHVVSDNLMYRIDSYLGFPENDPHGSPIPAWGKHLKPVTIKGLAPGDSFKVQDILLNEEQKQYYKERGFVRGSTWSVHEKTPDDAVYTLTNGKIFLAFSEQNVAKIFVMLHF